jgi:hypothetical protein
LAEGAEVMSQWMKEFFKVASGLHQYGEIDMPKSLNNFDSIPVHPKNS